MIGGEGRCWLVSFGISSVSGRVRLPFGVARGLSRGGARSLTGKGRMSNAAYTRRLVPVSLTAFGITCQRSPLDNCLKVEFGARVVPRAPLGRR